jgi:hypothetical protein
MGRPQLRRGTSMLFKMSERITHGLMHDDDDDDDDAIGQVFNSKLRYNETSI